MLKFKRQANFHSTRMSVSSVFLFKQNFAKSKKSEQMHFLFYNCKVTGKLNSIFNATGEWREVVKKAFMDKIHYV